MTAADKTLQSILELERLEHNLFRGRSQLTPWQRVFGGQVIGQALMAAQMTVEPDRFVHSLHGYFMLAGDSSMPIVYDVERLRDGGSFTTRRVTAIQNGRAIFSLEASFQVVEEGLEHQAPMPLDIPGPEELMSRTELLEHFGDRLPEPVARFWKRDRPIEMKPVSLDHYLSRDKLEPRQHNWVRVREPIADDRHMQAAVLAYLSDMTLLDTSTFAHGRALADPDIQAASLDHAMWFHRPNDLSDWLLYTQDSPWSGGSRGFNRGALYARDGTLVASVAQEGLVRLRTKRRT